MRSITLTVNNQKRTVDIEENETLLDVLRNRLHIKSVKAACWSGDCGICTVLLNSKPTKSCLVLACEAADSKIITVEGLSSSEKLHPLQQAFIDHGAVQCGFCTGAFLLMGYHIISKKQHFTPSEIQEMINGIICRCTGYQQIVDSIYEANEAQFM